MCIPVCRHLDTSYKKVRTRRTRPGLACTSGPDFLMASRKQDGHGIHMRPRPLRNFGVTYPCKIQENQEFLFFSCRNSKYGLE